MGDAKQQRFVSGGCNTAEVCLWTEHVVPRGQAGLDLHIDGMQAKASGAA